MTTKDEALQRLRELLKPNDTVYTVLRYVSKSGMMRRISIIKFAVKDGVAEPFFLDGLVVAAGVGRFKSVTRYGMSGGSWKSEEEGVVAEGCGMDMGFDLVYRLGRVLYPDGFAPSDLALRPDDGKRVNVNIGRGRGAGPLTRSEVEELAARGWKFEGGRNGDTSGWDNDGGYSLQHRWL